MVGEAAAPAVAASPAGVPERWLRALGVPVAALAAAPAAAPAAAEAAPVAVEPAAPQAALEAWCEAKELGKQLCRGIKRRVYLITLARVLAATLAERPHLRDPSTLTRSQVADAVRDAVDTPLAGSRGGRPSRRETTPLVTLVVFRETHEDGSFHFHVGIQLAKNCARCWVPMWRALLTRHGYITMCRRYC